MTSKGQNQSGFGPRVDIHRVIDSTVEMSPDIDSTYLLLKVVETF